MNPNQCTNDLNPGMLLTIAGVGYTDGIPAASADAGWPMGVARRPDGDLVVVDYQAHRIWRIDTNGILQTLAGTGIAGNSGDGGPANQAQLRNPHDLCQDTAGNLYFSDLGNATIRRIDYHSGIIERVAGSGKKGRGGDGGPALAAELDCTCGVVVDKAGNIFLSDEWACTVRRIDAKTGIIDTIAGQVARHYPSEQGPSRPMIGSGLSVMGYHGDGGPATQATFYHPEHLALDSQENLYVCDNSNDRIRKINRQTGIITTVLGNGQRASNGDGGPATQASTLMPDAICLDAHDNLYVGEKYGFRIRKVEAQTGLVTTLVGTGEPGFGAEGLPGSQTKCNSCEAGIWADDDGTVYWGDCSGRTRRYDGQTGIVTTVLGGTSVHDGHAGTQAFLNGPGGLSISPDGQLYIADVWNQRIRTLNLNSGIIHTVAGNGARAYGGDNGPATQAYLGNPHDVSVDSHGRAVIADTRHGHVRRIDTDGILRNIAGAAFQWDKGDGGPATNACLVHVLAVAHDADDNIYIGDAGAGRIRKIDQATGIITTIAGCGLPGYSGDHGVATQAQLGAPSAIGFDRLGNLYFTDAHYHVIRTVNTAGIITTLAGTGNSGFSPDGHKATEAFLHTPFGLAITPAGHIYFSDSANHRVRRIDANGRLTTVAGSTTPGDAGNHVLAVDAQLNEPHGLCLWGNNRLCISDRDNNRIRVLKLNEVL